jgi:hypothetical protein
VLVAIVLWQVLPRRWRWLGVMHALVTSLVVVVTANHYWIDGVVGTVIVLAALRLTRPRRMTRAAVRAGEPVIDLRDGRLLDPAGGVVLGTDELRLRDTAHVA